MKSDIFPDGLKGLVFDCDGVMIDSEGANRFFYNSILKWLGLPPMNKSQEQYAFMATALEALQTMVPESLHAKIPQAITEGINYNRDVLPRVTLMPDFREFINAAHNRGIFLAIDTNRTAEGIQRVLDFFSLPSYFDPVVSASVALPKPSPQGLELICEKWQTARWQILFIGDSENDRQTALNANVPFASFGNQGLTGTIEVRNYKELAQILGFNIQP